jgi:hypothetical protein
MLSIDLSNLADWVAGHAQRNEPLTAHAAAALAQALMDLAERAQQMELVPFRLSDPEVRRRLPRRTSNDVY